MPLKPRNLYALQRTDIHRAAGVLADAFGQDPLWKMILSDATPKQKVSAFETPLWYCLKYGAVYASSEKLEGLAACLPGAASAFTTWRLLWSGALGAALRLGWRIARKMEPIFGPLETQRREIMQDRPFVYLQILGVAATLQGRGFGSTILKTLIDDCERTGMALYLETETADNVCFYERFGFVVIRKISLPMVDLPMWLMVRPAGKQAGDQ
jgi:GNAT superfamily N-acetyltransferase